MKKNWHLALAFALASGTPGAMCAPPNEVAARFALLAGNEDNARILVGALQAGTEFELTAAGIDRCDGPTTVKFPAVASRLGADETIATLLRVQALLAAAGITHPSTPELQSALFGGTVPGADGKRVEMAGVLRKKN